MFGDGFYNNMEIEVKAKVDDVEEVRKKIRTIGGKLVFKNLIRDFSFDYGNREFQRKDYVFRIRVFENGEGMITFKGPRIADKKYKVREEVEVHVSDGFNAIKIFEHLGFKQVFRVDRIREIYEFKDKKVKIMLDIFPEIGSFIEVEGNKEDIEDIIQKLKIDRSRFSARTLQYYVEEFRKKFGRYPKLTFDD